MTRKAETPARMIRIRIPAPLALPANRRPPSRRTPGEAGAGSAGCNCEVTGLPSAGGDRVDRLLRLLAQRVRERRRARGVGRGLLAVLADHVVHEGPNQVGLGLVVVLHAADQVADQD